MTGDPRTVASQIAKLNLAFLRHIPCHFLLGNPHSLQVGWTSLRKVQIPCSDTRRRWMKERSWVKVDPLLSGKVLHNLSRSPSSFHIMGSFHYKFRPLHSHILKHCKFCLFPQRLFFRLMQTLKIKTLSNESTCFRTS
jgi:hypothetical protein